MTSIDRHVLIGALAGILLAGARPGLAEDEGKAASAPEAAEFYAAIRWRVEHVEQDPFARDATAAPFRARLGYESPKWNGLSFKLEYDHVFDLGLDEYNEGGGNTPDRVEYPVIADPAGGDVNQAYLQWRSAAGTRVRAGRQRIIYDNARFIGNVGWRQNEQTYDAVSLERLALGGFDVRVAYLATVQRIFGNDVPAGEHDMSTWIANASYAFGGAGRLTAYHYDIDNDDAPASSSRTTGLRWVADPLGDRVKFGYTLEYAHQGDAANNPVAYDADYLRADLSATFGKPTLSVGYEMLGGDASRTGAAFRTPLATLHAFNGWADQFLSTPDAGLVDVFVGGKGSLGSWTWNVVYHDFSAESGSGSFGHELDGSLQRKFAERYVLLLKAAGFRADGAGYGDTEKYWVQLSAEF